MRKIVLCFIIFQLYGCNELQQVVNQLPQSGTLGNEKIANGLKQALNFGIEKQVSTLSSQDGFFKNELVKILLPEELKKVDKTLRDIGLSKLADEGLRILNNAAEDAVGEATPIFIEAVKNMSFTDAKNILLGTNTQLYSKFNPIIEQSFKKVGADQVWNNLITKYNTLPFTNEVNPDLTDYVTQEALKGVYTMIAVEEKEIRTKVSSRTTDLLKNVFRLQD